jgi:hypothetical protein
MISPTKAITDLQAQWHTLQDLDRAEAVSTIHLSGVSLRSLARALNCSDGLLRHLLHALEASPEDLALARQGQITTWETARRSMAIRTGRAPMHRDDSEIEMANAIANGCAAIRGWLADQILNNPYGVRVTKEAHRLLVNAEKAGKLSCGQAPAGFTTDEIIRRCQPKEPKPQDAEVVSWFARWLAIWTFYVIPNARVRQQALLLSIENSSVAQ